MKFLPLTLLALPAVASAFVVPHNNLQQQTASVLKNALVVATTNSKQSSWSLRMSDESSDDDGPSDVNDDNYEEESLTTSVQDAGQEEEKVENIDKYTMQKLLEIGARTGRGEFASSEEKQSALELIEALEYQNPSSRAVMWEEKIYGRWELVYCSTELFRSSPFFMAGRAVCETDEQAKQYNWFCEMHRKALSISTIGAVRQIVSPNRLISEFEVKAGAIPFSRKFTPFSYSGGLPVTIEGAIVSSADISATDDGDAWEISMDTVEIKGSNLPGMRQLLDSGFKLESRQVGNLLESNLPNYSNPKPILETTYLDDRVRISRDQDNNVFVFSKVSNSMEPTDYSGVMPDLGITRLMEGFNDSVTKIYL